MCSGVGLMSSYVALPEGLPNATIADLFLTSPSTWSLGDRVLLNGRRLFLGRESRRGIQKQDPVQ
jgi:hypothetical protein